MWYERHSARGIGYIIFGSLLFFLVAGEFLIRFLLVLLALSIINYGLRMQGRPPVHIVVFSWLDRIGF